VVLAPSMTLCTETCPLTTGALIELTRELRAAGLARRVTVVEVTVDPWRDTPARLRAYRKLAGVNFQMLTGSKAQIHRFWKFFGVYYKRVPQGSPPAIDWMTHRPEKFDVDHTDGLFFLDPEGQERIVDEGMADVTGKLPASLRRLLSASGEHNLAHPQLPWTATEALGDVDFLMGRPGPDSGGTAHEVSAPAARRDLSGSPEKLAALHREAGRLITDATLRSQVQALRGRYPVVVNVWASWCPPCRGEFPILSTVSSQLGRQVAFLGADVSDTPTDARAFLAKHPVSYPSYSDTTSNLSWLTAIGSTPTTIFINRAGHVTHIQDGSYASLAALRNDVEQYALGTHG